MEMNDPRVTSTEFDEDKLFCHCNRHFVFTYEVAFVQDLDCVVLTSANVPCTHDLAM